MLIPLSYIVVQNDQALLHGSIGSHSHLAIYIYICTIHGIQAYIDTYVCKYDTYACTLSMLAIIS